jgi:hypothetical protein
VAVYMKQTADKAVFWCTEQELEPQQFPKP